MDEDECTYLDTQAGSPQNCSYSRELLEALTSAIESEVNSSAGRSRARRRNESLLGYTAISLLTCAIIAYAIILNRIYYQHGGPFYDSTSYLTSLSTVMTRARVHGFSDAFKQQLGSSTVFMPWFQGMCLSYFIKPSRVVGILIQAVWLLALSLSVFRYFYSVRRYDVAAALALTLPFIAPACLFFLDGGLSDFRMDLLQYLTLSTAAIFYLSTYEARSKFNWIMCGLFLGISCLCRATSLVYIVITYAPLLSLRLLYSEERKALVHKCILSLLPFGLTAAWFYATNAAFLYYYYCVWNPDANAKLPLSISILHAVCLVKDLGYFWISFGILVGSVSTMLWYKSRKKRLSVNWVALWIGLVPCGFLVVRGAGLNPFVSMPSIFGLLLFLMVPINSIRLNTRPMGTALLALSLCCAIATAAPAVKEHRKGFQTDGYQATSINAFKSVQDAMMSDMRTRHLSTARFYVAHLAWFSSDALINSFIYDQGFEPDLAPDDGVIKDGLHILPRSDLAPPTELEWNSKFFRPGAALNGIPLLVQDCKENVDYIILLTDDSARGIATTHKVNFINTKITAIRDALLQTGQLSPISDVIENSPAERFVVYRVNRHSQPN